MKSRRDCRIGVAWCSLFFLLISQDIGSSTGAGFTACILLMLAIDLWFLAEAPE